jgi:glycosyltransferase involved in cell wall biosynthesis
MNGLRLGGMERQLVELIKALSGTQVEAHLAILNSKGPYSDVVEHYLEDPVIYLDRRKSKIPATLSSLHKIVHNKQIHLIHVQDSFSCYYALPVAKWNKLPLINGMIRHAGVSKGLEYRIEKWMLRFSDIIIANSRAGLDYYGIKHGHIMYNLIDQTRFRQATGTLRDIVMNANFHHLKDHRTFFDAMRELNKMDRLGKVGLIGDGPTRPFYEQLAKDYGLSGKVRFYGFISNVEDVLADYGIGILCSTKKYKEGISNSLLEYMGSGLITIASETGATPEVIDNSINGFLIEPEDIQSLVKAVKFIQGHRHLIKIIRDNAITTLSRVCHPKTNVSQFIAILSTVSYQSVN